MLQSLSYLTIALHVSGIIITHLQEHKTAVTTASGNRYTEQGTGEQNPLFQLAIDTMLTSANT
jgi:hypothetical protein